MKNKFLLLISFIFISIPAYTYSAESGFAEVQTKVNYIRKFNRFYAPVKLKVAYGDKLRVIQKDGDWFKVSFNNVEGFIHKSAIVKMKKRKLQPVLLGAEMTPEAEDEVTLAGKGFNAQVEKKMGDDNPELNYLKVDDILAYQVNPEAIESFIKEGELRLPK